MASSSKTSTFFASYERAFKVYMYNGLLSFTASLHGLPSLRDVNEFSVTVRLFFDIDFESLLENYILIIYNASRFDGTMSLLMWSYVSLTFYRNHCFVS